MEEYGIEQIQHLNFREGVRNRVQMYLGSDDIDGAYQAIKEIVNNSTDEYLAGFGDKLEITYGETDNSVSVRDYGRGVPFGINENGDNVLIDIYTKSHTGGKFGKGVYKNASGLNGIGAKCACLSSLDFLVQSFRDGKGAEARFHQGNLVNYEEFNTSEKNGTYVWFIPDPEVFKNGDIKYSYDKICQDTKDISYLYKMEFVVKSGRKKQSYKAENGIVDFIKDNLSKPLNKNIMYKVVEDENDRLEIAYQWGSKKEEGYVFVNGLRCPEGGTPITGAKSSITKTINNLTKMDVEGDLIRGNLFYVINCTVKNPSFANQTKSKINNANLRTLASNAFNESLKEMSIKYKEDFETITTLIKKLAKADAAAERARNAVLDHQREAEANSKKKIIESTKLRDARVLGQDSILLLVEGNSAGGSMSIGRDVNKYGILMLRGKILNLLKSSTEDALGNEEIKLLLQALGLIYGKPYNSSKLRYGKIAIATDADPDGYNIGLLIMAALYVLCPKFLEENRLYWLKAPLYKVSTKTKNYYYYSDEEFEGHPTGEIIRYKG